MVMVLLIEDDEQIRELLPRYFTREGITMQGYDYGG